MFVCTDLLSFIHKFCAGAPKIWFLHNCNNVFSRRQFMNCWRASQSYHDFIVSMQHNQWAVALWNIFMKLTLQPRSPENPFVHNTHFSYSMVVPFHSEHDSITQNDCKTTKYVMAKRDFSGSVLYKSIIHFLSDGSSARNIIFGWPAFSNDLC